MRIMEFEPDTISNKRNAQRVQLGEAVQFESAGRPEGVGSLGFDISEGGLRMRFNDYVPVGTELSLRITLPDQTVINCIGVVMWVNKEPLNESYTAGIRFESTENVIDSKKKIHHYIESFQS